MSPNRPRQSGFSLVEILLVLGLISVIAIGAFVIYPRVKMSQDVSDAVNKFGLVSGAVRSFFGTRPFVGVTRENAIAAGLATEAELTSKWGEIGIRSYPATPYLMVVQFMEVPSAACKKLLPRLEPVSDRMVVGGTYVKRVNTTAAYTIEYDMLTAASHCDAADKVNVQLYLD